MAVIVCEYCGGEHERAAEVRGCWERSGAAAPDGGRSGGDRPASEPSVAGRDRSGAGRPSGGGADPVAARAGPLLGRSVLVRPGQRPPGPWASCERSGGSLADLEQLEQAWRERVPLVIEIADDDAGGGPSSGGPSSGGPSREDEPSPGASSAEGSDHTGGRERAPVWSLPPSFAFAAERLAHARFANAADARGGAAATLALGSLACRLGAGAGGSGDVVLPDGRAAVLDGGPLCWHAGLGEMVVVPRIALLAGSLRPFGANATAAELAPDQLAAVTQRGGAARVIAPAGSGKTRVLTERARHLLGPWALPASALTLVAFNRRAAEEMSERTPDLPALRVRTLNALGLSILGRSRAVTTIEERDVRTILGRLVDLPRRANADPAAAWIEALSAVRLGLSPPERVEADFGGDVTGLAEVFDRYRAVLADRQAVDFDEQVYGALEVLLADPAARRAARAACRVMLVDEFQDLTPAHLLLVRLLAGPDGNVFGVGDDDQTIYGYTGASPDWLIGYRRFFPAASEHALEVNYRCPSPVVSAAARLVGHNRRRVAKAIRPAPGREADPGSLRVIDTADGLAAAVSAVLSLLGAGSEASEIAVLARVTASLAPVQVALVHEKVPVRPAVDTSYLQRNGVQAALAWLRLATCGREGLPGADVALAARRPSRGLSPRVVEWMAEQQSVAALDALARRLSGRDADKVGSFAADLAALRVEASRGTTASLLRSVRDDIGLDQAMELLEASRRRLDRSAQTDDLDALVALGALHVAPSGFEEWLRSSLAEPGAAAGVTLSTIHRVKGREWPHVVVHDVRVGVLPHRLAGDLEEERRVFHVAITRASRSVTVVTGGEASGFVAELDEDAPPPPSRPGARPAAGSPPGASLAPAGRGRAAGSPGRPPPAPHRAGGDRRPGSAAVAGRRNAPALSGGTAPGADLSPQSLRAREALRTWRAARAAAESKPAYVYLHDRTIDAVAAALPADLAGLAAIAGIGPAKLDAYGEEWLELLEASRDGSEAD